MVDGTAYPRCNACGMQVARGVWGTTGHLTSVACGKMGIQREQHRLAAAAGRARGRRFYAYGNELRNVDQFRYLGRMLSEADCDVPAVRRNLKKARGVWRRIANVIAKDSVPAPIAGMFFRVVVESVLLYGSETWSLSPTALRCLDGFQVEAARRFTGMLPKKRGDVWVYPKSADVMAAAGLRPIRESILRRRRTVLAAIEGRKILEECREAERQPESPARQYWWEQEFDLDAEDEGEAPVGEPP